MSASRIALPRCTDGARGESIRDDRVENNTEGERLPDHAAAGAAEPSAGPGNSSAGDAPGARRRVSTHRADQALVALQTTSTALDAPAMLNAILERCGPYGRGVAALVRWGAAAGRCPDDRVTIPGGRSPQKRIRLQCLLLSPECQIPPPSSKSNALPTPTPNQLPHDPPTPTYHWFRSWLGSSGFGIWHLGVVGAWDLELGI